jgi:hypothetical protein
MRFIGPLKSRAPRRHLSRPGSASGDRRPGLRAVELAFSEAGDPRSLQWSSSSAVLFPESSDEPASFSGNGCCALWGEPGVQSSDKTLITHYARRRICRAADGSVGHLRRRTSRALNLLVTSQRRVSRSSRCRSAAVARVRAVARNPLLHDSRVSVSFYLLPPKILPRQKQKNRFS